MPVIFESKANVFETEAQTVTCTVNLVGVMGAGVAKEYKRRYPKAFLKYSYACSKGFSIGQLLLQHLPDGKFGLCLPTKKHWRNNSELEWIEESLKKLVATYKQYGIKSIAMTPLGCGNGGLNYQTQVRPIMMKYLNQLDIPVYICM